MSRSPDDFQGMEVYVVRECPVIAKASKEGETIHIVVMKQ